MPSKIRICEQNKSRIKSKKKLIIARKKKIVSSHKKISIKTVINKRRAIKLDETLAKISSLRNNWYVSLALWTN